MKGSRTSSAMRMKGGRRFFAPQARLSVVAGFRPSARLIVANSILAGVDTSSPAKIFSMLFSNCGTALTLLFFPSQYAAPIRWRRSLSKFSIFRSSGVLCLFRSYHLRISF